MRPVLAFVWVLWAASAPASYRVVQVVALSLGELQGKGQVADPRTAPGGGELSFELLGAGGDTLEVYTATLALGDKDAQIGEPRAVLPVAVVDPFSLGRSSHRPVSEQVSWGPPKRKRSRFALAATRKASPRGGAQVNFDLYLVEPGRKRYLTEHPENDAHPAFHPQGEFIAFSSGRSGQGDIYLYHFFADTDPLVQLSYEAAGSELYPVWGPRGERLAFVGHLGSEDHILLLEGVQQVVAAAPGGRRQAAARRATRDLTTGWRVSCLAPSFSPDGTWLAFYAREGQGDRADLYVAATDGSSPPRRLLQGGIPETRGGPRWAPGGEGILAVKEDAARFNPLIWVPLAADAAPVVLDTGTELNADPWLYQGEGNQALLLFAAQGGGGEQKRWRRIYLARLQWEDSL